MNKNSLQIKKQSKLLSNLSNREKELKKAVRRNQAAIKESQEQTEENGGLINRVLNATKEYMLGLTGTDGSRIGNNDVVKLSKRLKKHGGSGQMASTVLRGTAGASVNSKAKLQPKPRVANKRGQSLEQIKQAVQVRRNKGIRNSKVPKDAGISKPVKDKKEEGERANGKDNVVLGPAIPIDTRVTNIIEAERGSEGVPTRVEQVKPVQTNRPVAQPVKHNSSSQFKPKGEQVVRSSSSKPKSKPSKVKQDSKHEEVLVA